MTKTHWKVGTQTQRNNGARVEFTCKCIQKISQILSHSQKENVIMLDETIRFTKSSANKFVY